MKKSIMILLSLVLVLQICICVLPQREVQAATGTTYYVSSSLGDDNNPGTSEAKPWKTLAKVSSITFKRGDTILLKRGDVWENESLTLNVEDGVGRQLVSAYGEGDKRPYINPKNSNGYGGYGIGILSTDEKKSDGWEIVGLEIGETGNGILYKDTRNCARTDALTNGLTVKDCYIHDCTRNLPEGSTGGFMAGVTTHSKYSYFDNILVEDCLIERCELGMQGDGMRYFKVLNTDMLYGEYYGFQCNDSKYGLIKGCDILHTGTKRRQWGTTGMEFDQYSEHIVVDDCEIAYTKSIEGSADGCAIDFESWTYDITVANCYFHDNAGRVFLMMPYPSSETKIYNNLAVNNGTDHDSMEANGMETEPAFLLWFDDSLANGGEISGNVIVKAFPGQSANIISYAHVDTFPRSTYNKNNVILPYGSEATAPARREIEEVTVTGDRKVWDFSDGEQGWWANDGVDNFKVEGGVLSGGATKHFVEISSSELNLKVTKYPYIKVVMKNETSATFANVTFMTDMNAVEMRDEAISEVEIVPFDSEYREYVFDMTAACGYSGVLTGLNLAPVNGAEAGGFKIKSITLSANKETTYKDTTKVSTGSLKSTVASWDFTKGDQGFTAAGFKTGSNNVLSFQEETEEYLLSPDHLNIDLSKANAISIKMKNASDSDSASISFVTEKDGYYDLVKTKHFKVNKSENGVTEYLIDLSDNKSFTGTLKEFRINPARADAGSIELVSIAIGSK